MKFAMIFSQIEWRSVVSYRKCNLHKNFNYEIVITYLKPVILYGSEAYGYNALKNVMKFSIETCVFQESTNTLIYIWSPTNGIWDIWDILLI